jgi:Bacterial regulatory helix-turn-helix protein, lysR family
VDRLTAMEAFVRVVDAGSFSGAAKQLRVGQPAVSKTVAQLEDRLGVRLLLRSTHRLTPTEAGGTSMNAPNSRSRRPRKRNSRRAALPQRYRAACASVVLLPLRACSLCRVFQSSSPSIPRSMSMSFSRTATLILLQRALTWRCS